MASIFETTNLDVNVFDFDEFLSDDELLKSFDDNFGASLASATDTPDCGPQSEIGNKRKNTPDSVMVAHTKRMKKKGKTVIQLPNAVRSTEFAHFMLDERFKVRPAVELQDNPEMKLYNFPRFNRCDALTYFPSTLVSFMNNGDVSAISDLFNSFFHRNCEVRIPTGLAGPASHFLEFQHLMNDMHPDQIICVRSTKEINNEIRADVYFKLIENKAIYESVARTGNRAAFLEPFLVASRAEHLKAKFNLFSKTDDEMHALTELLDSGADVELFGRIDMRMVFNKHSKRVLEFKMVAEMTDFRRIDISNALLQD